MELESRHQCLIYEGAPSKQLPTLANLMQKRLAEGYRCVYLNSPPMVAGLRSSLAAKGIDVMQEAAQARLILSSDTTLNTEGAFDVDLMLNKLEDALDQALGDGYHGLFAVGDMTWEFGPRNDFSKLLEYEWRLEKLFRKRRELRGICQYHQDTLPREATRQALLTHRTLFINETLTRINPYFVSAELFPDEMATNPELDEMVTALCRLQQVNPSLANK
jgi:hypothetical protein